jgi:phage shock protein PspC (stress-responsive transcriptional regulator)
MALSDELDKLDELHRRGVLSDDEFSRAKARVLDAAGPDRPAPGLAAVNGLRRSRSDRWLGGVCGGLAQITDVAGWIWRLGFVLLVLCAGTGLLVYLLLWILVPEDDAPLARDAGTWPRASS